MASAMASLNGHAKCFVLSVKSLCHYAKCCGHFECFYAEFHRVCSIAPSFMGPQLACHILYAKCHKNLCHYGECCGISSGHAKCFMLNEKRVSVIC